MDKLNIVFTPHSKLRINLIETNIGYEFIFEGVIDFIKAEKILTPIFYDFHEKIIKQSIKFVVLDIKKLSFINSSGIKAIIHWVLKFDDLPDNNKYKFIFKTNHIYTWQKSSIALLKRISFNNITIAEEHNGK